MILTRSPYYINVVFTNNFVNAVNFTVTIGNGSFSSINAIDSYNLTKRKPSDTATNTWLDVSPFISDLFDQKPIDVSLYNAPTVISSNEVLLASISEQQEDSLGSQLPLNSFKYRCTEGYGYYTEGQNYDPNKKILLSHTGYKAFENGYFVVPLECDSSSPDPTVEGVAVPLNFTDEVSNYVKYLVIPLGEYSDNITVSYDGESIDIELIEECKYPVSSVQFLNRFGVIEQVHFYKAVKETVNTKSEKFKNAYTNGVTYDVKRHQSQVFNKTSNKSIKIETGYLNPDYNQTMQELMESEKVWINSRPVNVTSNSLEFKTRIVDKLISYSISFDYAYDEINNI